MEDCLFCMIAEGKIPSKKLYEDDQVVAFYGYARYHPCFQNLLQLLPYSLNVFKI